MNAYASGLLTGFILGLAVAAIAFVVWLVKEPPPVDPDDES